MQGLLEARQEIRPLLFKPNDRLKDLLFLDIALESTVRTAIERGYEELNNARPEVIPVISSVICQFLLPLFPVWSGSVCVWVVILAYLMI